MKRIEIGDGFSVSEEALEKYWRHIGDRLADKRYREVTDIQVLENQRQELHDALIRSAGFDPELRFKSDSEQRKTGFWNFTESLEDYIAKRLAEESGVDALNRRILGI